MKKNAVSMQIVPFRFAPKFTLGFTIIALFLAIVFCACATQNMQSISTSTKLGFEDAMREVCWSVESQEQCFEILATTCEALDYRNCTILGNAYLSELDFSSNLTDDYATKDKAVELFKKACDGKNGSGCFALGMIQANDDFVIQGCEYGDFVACNHIVINRDSSTKDSLSTRLTFEPQIVQWALNREIELLESECDNAKSRLKNENNKERISSREAVLKECQEQLQKARNTQI